MGLDMYLVAKQFLWTDEHEEIKRKLGTDLEPCTIEYDVMYWRKANAIHKWFVKNVQDGNDDCGYYYVSREKLKELLDAIKAVLKNHEKASELLPAQEGFFFGGIEFDNYYFEILTKTEKKLKEILKDKRYEEMDFEYHSSW